MRKLISFTGIFIVAATVSLSAQHKMLGIKGTIGTTEGSTSYTMGIDFEQKLSTRWGYTFGAFHKTNMIFNPIKLYFIHMPATVRYYTRYVNVSAGLSGDFFTGNSTPNGYTNVQADMDPAFQLGFLGSISKDIHLNKHLIIEPEIYINPSINGILNYYGVGLSLKYIFYD
jgi:hypothetical protein